MRNQEMQLNAENAKLEANFMSLSPARQQKNAIFWELPTADRQELMANIHQELFQAYRNKMMGPNLRHCSSKTKDFCLAWCAAEQDLALIEDAIAQYDIRIMVEASLTKAFEKHQKTLLKKYQYFYECQWDEKTEILEKMEQEAKEIAKAKQEASALKAKVLKDLQAAQSENKIDDDKSKQLLTKVKAIKEGEKDAELYAKIYATINQEKEIDAAELCQDLEKDAELNQQKEEVAKLAEDHAQDALQMKKAAIQKRMRKTLWSKITQKIKKQSKAKTPQNFNQIVEQKIESAINS